MIPLKLPTHFELAIWDIEKSPAPHLATLQPKDTPLIALAASLHDTFSGLPELNNSMHNIILFYKLKSNYNDFVIIKSLRERV